MLFFCDCVRNQLCEYNFKDHGTTLVIELYNNMIDFLLQRCYINIEDKQCNKKFKKNVVE